MLLSSVRQYHTVIRFMGIIKLVTYKAAVFGFTLSANLYIDFGEHSSDLVFRDASVGSNCALCEPKGAKVMSPVYVQNTRAFQL